MNKISNEEFEHLLEFEDVGDTPRTIKFSADENERARIAALFDIIELKSLTAELNYRRVGSGTIQIIGEYKAHVVQSCVVTLEPVQTLLGSSFERQYEVGEPTTELDEVDFEPDAEDPPEYLAEPRINLVDVVAEQLGLDIPPFPRNEGADLSSLGYVPDESADEKPNPFAILKTLRQ